MDLRWWRREPDQCKTYHIHRGNLVYHGKSYPYGRNQSSLAGRGSQSREAV